MENSVIVGEYPNGVVRQFVTENGQKFEAYIPNDYDKNTNVILYEHGDGGYYNDWKTYKAKFEAGECDSIIIRADRYKSIDLYNYIIDEYELSRDHTINVSFSGGTPYAFTETKQMIELNPDGIPPLNVVLDGYISYAHLNSNGTSESIVAQDGIVLAFGRYSSYYADYKRYAQTSGVNMILFKDTSSYGKSHVGVNNSFMEGGLIEYFEDRGELPDRYEIEIYDAETGEFRKLEHSEVATLRDVYALFGVDYPGKIDVVNYTLADLSQIEDLAVTSDSGVLEASLNKIRGVIRSTNIVSSGYTDSGCSSTTMMPSQIGAVVSRFIQSTTSCLSKIVNETAQFAAIGESIEDMNFNLERAAMEIDDIDLVRAVYGSMPSVTEEDVKQEYMEATDSTIPTNEIVEEKEQPVSTDSTVNNVETNYDVIEKDTVSDEKTDDVTKPDIVVPSYNDSTSGGNSGNSNNSGSSNKPAINPGSISAGALIGGSSVPSNNTIDTSGSKDIKEEMKRFISYDELLSDDNKLVYECGDGCKLVIYKDGDKVVGVEYFFDLKKSNATLEQLKTRFEIVEHFQEIINENNNAKVFLDVKVFDDKSLEDIKKMFDEMDGYEMV